MKHINTLIIAICLLILLVVLVAYWYAAIGVAVVTLIFLAARGITYASNLNLRR